jgi:DNA-binding NarL/FixJ family response regulator
MKLLIVDDSKIILDEFCRLFQTINGVEIVGKAKDENEALVMFYNSQPHVVILDIRLKEGSGINLLKRIKKKIPSTIVMMLTNYALPRYRKKCQKLGADYFYDKLTELPQVIRKIKELSDQINDSK